ncbi:heavy-metal-associated domain-containing protein [Halomonas sp. A29]|uniref:heavy-metal-associated domain-containing protein n=1 Tax=Halomonas sp. A29 TaxID=3102786 RepID=UPI00398B6486
MPTFNVPQMTCGHCASTVTTAIKAVDANASVDIDLEQRQVTVESSADTAALAAVLEKAGYPNELA